MKDGKKSLMKQIEEVRGRLNNLIYEKDRINKDEQILKVSRQLDILIVNYMMA